MVYLINRGPPIDQWLENWITNFQVVSSNLAHIGIVRFLSLARCDRNLQIFNHKGSFLVPVSMVTTIINQFALFKTKEKHIARYIIWDVYHMTSAVITAIITM